MGIFSLAFIFFVIMDPLGNIPVFLAVLNDFKLPQQRSIIFREMIIALAVMLLFIFCGEKLLSFLGIGSASIQLAGGLILFIIAMKMVFPPHTGTIIGSKHNDPFIVPLAVPLIAGPTLLAAIMIYTPQEPLADMLGGIGLSWAVSLVILLLSTYLKKLLGEKGLSACEKLMGLILVMIATEMFLDGIKCFINNCSF